MRIFTFFFIILFGCITVVNQKPIKETKTKEEKPIPTQTIFDVESKEVTVTGVSAIVSTKDIARDNAIRDAQRKAIEEAVGAFISSETKVNNFTLLSDKIYSQAKGYVSSYEIISEKIEGDIYKVRIRAKVKMDKIEDDLVAIGLLIAQKNRPRVMMLFDNESIETMLISEFDAKGFPLIDREIVQRNISADVQKAIIDGDYKRAKLIGLKLGAELVVVGRTSCKESVEKIPYTSDYKNVYKVTIDAKTISTETAEIIASSHLTKKLPISEEQAKSEAVKEVAKELINKILSKWTKVENITQIHIKGVTFNELLNLKSAIKENIRGVKEVIQREFTENYGVLEIVSETNSQEILEELETKDLGIKFNIKSFFGNRIDLEIKK